MLHFCHNNAGHAVLGRATERHRCIAPRCRQCVRNCALPPSCMRCAATQMTTPTTSSLGPSRHAVNTGSHSPAVQLHDLQHSAAKSIIAQARGTPSPPAEQQQEEEEKEGEVAAATSATMAKAAPSAAAAEHDAGPRDAAQPAAASAVSDPSGPAAAAATGGQHAGAAGDSSAALLPQAAAQAEGAAPPLPPAPASSMPLHPLPLDSQAAATYLLPDDQVRQGYRPACHWWRGGGVLVANMQCNTA